jgi:hypothetical protein
MSPDSIRASQAITASQPKPEPKPKEEERQVSAPETKAVQEEARNAQGVSTIAEA